MSLTDWVTLDVGGRVISTYRSTLVSCPSSMLAKMFSQNSSLEPAKTHGGHYSIDTDPDIFTVILNWLRYRKVDKVIMDHEVHELLLGAAPHHHHRPVCHHCCRIFWAH